ncbi:MAG: DUF5131 family protein [Candidatus Tenebribacter davisii]|nr:DUF5131 family protein [Candidatus Tenebribacter davisii]
MKDLIISTWNPLGGACPHECKYCSTEKLMRYPVIKEKYTGEVKFIEKEMNTNLGSENFIFVCAQHDLFAKEVPESWISRILMYCSKFNNKYLFQSKNPARMHDFLPLFPVGSMLCTTVETNRPELIEEFSGGAIVEERVEAIGELYGAKRMITIEPVMAFDVDRMADLIIKADPDFIAIGANTGLLKLPEPTKDDVIRLIGRLEVSTRNDCIIHIKPNLERIIGKR